MPAQAHLHTHAKGRATEVPSHAMEAKVHACALLAVMVAQNCTNDHPVPAGLYMWQHACTCMYSGHVQNVHCSVLVKALIEIK